MSFRWLGAAVVSALALASSGFAVESPQIAQAARRPVTASFLSLDPSATTNVLKGVSAVSASNVWAVGYYDNNKTGVRDTLILHWNGTTWKQVAAPNPSSSANDLYGAAATSASNAWAVGDYVSKTTGADDTLILHWNGTTWKQVAAPNPSSSANDLHAVSVVSASSAWAVGQYKNNTTGEYDTLVLHWNGTAWKQVSSPNASPGPQDRNFLNGVSATSAGNAWAAGDYDTSTNTSQTLIVHWNGTAWKQSTTPSPSRLINDLDGVTATSATNAWAVGQYQNNTTDAYDTLILRWNGTTWSQAKSPSPGSLGSFLTGASATSASNAWAMGYTCTNVACTFSDTLILHWKGTSWSKTTSPNPSATANVLSGVSGTSAADAWAVGDYDNNKTGAMETLILHWNGMSWSKS